MASNLQAIKVLNEYVRRASMGMYTELNLSIKLKKDTPDDIIKAITYMCESDEGNDYVDCTVDFNTDHKLFKDSRWSWMLQSGGSYYFDTTPHLTWRYDDISKQHYLSFCTNIKNYNSEWENLLDYLAPHIDSNTEYYKEDEIPKEDWQKRYISTYRYEEAEKPTLLYALDGEVIWETL